jgi:hypothetical protein
MTPHDRLRVSVDSARYLDALERGDVAELQRLWRLAETDAELQTAFREIHAGLLEEQDAELMGTIAAAAQKHLPSAEVVRPATGPVTVADVADELFRHTPDRLPADAHRLNERLRQSPEPIPTDLGLPKLIAWAEAKYGPAVKEYWKAFHQVVIKLHTRRESAEYQVAARKAPNPEDRK